MVFERVGQIEVYRQRADADARGRSDATERIFQLIDGRLTVRRIIDLSRIGTFEATRVLADLHSAAMIRPVAAKALREARKADRPVKPMMERVRFTLAAVLPLVLLMGLVWAGLDGHGAPTRLTGLPVPSQPLADIRQDFELRRLRHAIETHRLIEGDWPESLEAAAAVEDQAAFALTESDGAPYYYRRRDGGILLLAPTR
jgi:hypothetical protein